MVALDLTEFEARLLKWISASDFVEVAWSTKRAAEAFKVKEKEVYEAYFQFAAIWAFGGAFG